MTDWLIVAAVAPAVLVASVILCVERGIARIENRALRLIRNEPDPPAPLPTARLIRG
jgi:hypothetical protein